MSSYWTHNPEQLDIRSNSFYQMPTNKEFAFDSRNVEIKTNSIEQTLLPLVTQVKFYILSVKTH